MRAAGPPREISIHALREEGDSRSTPPFRRPRYFYPRPPRGGRPRQTVSSLRTSYFYPRPPRGGRRLAVLSPYSPAKFLSTLSARRATDRQKHSSRTFTISIHALREEGDPEGRQSIGHNVDFYPRPPRGGRPRALALAALLLDFYPRPPRGGRLEDEQTLLSYGLFLSTPSARRATFPDVQQVGGSHDFYPRPPRGGRRRR